MLSVLAFMALDDIMLVEGTCDSYLQPSTTPPPDPFQMWKCDFEGGHTCSWTQDTTGDQFNWTVYHGPTPTDFTGPTTDHTTENGTVLESS